MENPAFDWPSAKDLATKYGVTPKTVWVWTARGQFPKPRKIGPNTTRWRPEVIERHEAECQDGVCSCPRSRDWKPKPQTKIAAKASVKKRKEQRSKAA